MANADFAVRQPLSIDLHAATRAEHASLNRNIIARLPLCLSDKTSDPTLYLEGMTVVGRIYSAFEKAWDEIILNENLNEEQKVILKRLDIPQLRRTSRLQSSLNHIAGKIPTAYSIHSDLSYLQQASDSLHDEIVSTITSKPHTLLAYTWTMYLALFNGGRWIAKQLLAPGPAFWTEPDRESVVQNCLSFWFFSDDETYDGEDLKIRFKDSFNDVSEMLTDSERQDVIQTTKRIFQICGEMIEMLDEHVQSDDTPTSQLGVSRLQGSNGPSDVESSKPSPESQSYITTLIPPLVRSLWRSIIPSFSHNNPLVSVTLATEIDQKSG